MLIDHIGVVLFPEVYILRIIGRISMPLFAYCIARGFHYSKEHGTLRKYITNMLIFALISQIPFCFFGDGLNIGFTWFFSLLLLTISTMRCDVLWKRVITLVVTYGTVATLLGTNLVPVDYGFAGVMTPLLFYLLIIIDKETVINYVLAILISWACYVVCSRTPSSLVQIASVMSVPVLVVSKKYDKVIRIPKWVSYAFYPAHITVLLIIRHLIV